MATTAISSGRLVRRTEAMPPKRAAAFAKMLLAGREPVRFAEVVSHGAKKRVEFVPVSDRAQARMFEEVQGRRIARSVAVRSYHWRRMLWMRVAWKCRGPQGQEYVVRLDPPYCECADWYTISSVGGRCKHYVAALEAERRYQEHLKKKEGTIGRE